MTILIADYGIVIIAKTCNTSFMKGFALLEVIVALLVISLGILGIIGMQLSALENSQTAYLQSIASTQLAAMLDQLRANHSPSSREIEWQRWNSINTQLLPKGQGSYRCAADFCTVSLQWEFDKLYSSSLSALLME